MRMTVEAMSFEFGDLILSCRRQTKEHIEVSYYSISSNTGPGAILFNGSSDGTVRGGGCGCNFEGGRCVQMHNYEQYHNR